MTASGRVKIRSVAAHPIQAIADSGQHIHKERSMKMVSNRVLSLNDVASDFSVEELEPRMEMQMLGFGTDPSIIVITGGGGGFFISGVIFTPSGVWFFS
jgi:hypothetical protein